METKNLYSHPIEDKDILRSFTHTPPSPDIYIGEDGTVRNVPGHKRFVSKEGVVTDLTHACDFLCKEGTPIKSALEGCVVDLYTNVKRNYDGITPPPEKIMSEREQEGNYVVLQHSNGEYSIYSHLQPEGVLIKQGQNVKVGEVIGKSGNTGWSLEPHLHFAVFKFLGETPDQGIESLGVRWKK